MDDSRPDVVERANPCTKIGVAHVVMVKAFEEIEETFREVEDFEDDEYFEIVLPPGRRLLLTPGIGMGIN